MTDRYNPSSPIVKSVMSRIYGILQFRALKHAEYVSDGTRNAVMDQSNLAVRKPIIQ